MRLNWNRAWLAPVLLCAAVWAQDKPERVPSDAGPVQVSDGVIAGTRLSGADPVYPVAALLAHEQGSVVLHAIISKDGKVANLKVISGPEMLRQAALDAVKTWTYKPYIMNGQSIEVDTTITVSFSMKG